MVLSTHTTPQESDVQSQPRVDSCLHQGVALTPTPLSSRLAESMRSSFQSFRPSQLGLEELSRCVSLHDCDTRVPGTCLDPSVRFVHIAHLIL